MTWDADLRLHGPGGWRHHAYRVLLTRARQGLVICVPPGDEGDATRQPEFYDGTFEYLRGLGVSAV